MTSKCISNNSPANLFNQEGVQTDSLITQYDFIDKYLNLNPFSFRPQQTPFYQKKQQGLIQEEVQSFRQSDPFYSIAKTKRAKSPFHNFQKHLITIIKKLVSLSRKKLILEEGGALAYAIWTVFLENSTANKKALNLVFGVVQINTSLLQLQSLSKQNESFRKIYTEHSYQQICAAQKMLRERVVVQANTLSKQFLNSNSSIGRFEQFYLYFRSFIDQIQAGPLSRRMSKETKTKIMPKELPVSFEV